jgi:hypothetical protein
VIMNFNRQFWWLIFGSSACIVLGIFGLYGLISSMGSSISILWVLFCFLMLGCGILGLVLSFVWNPIREKIVSIPTRIVFFGASCGLPWSLAPGGLGDRFRTVPEVVAVLVASIITGVLVSFTLSKPLMKFNREYTVLLGILSLPIGAFCFGVCISFTSLIVRHITGESFPGDEKFMPLTEGATYALLSVLSLFAVILFPLAVLTTFLLRSVIRHNPRQ